MSRKFPALLFLALVLILLAPGTVRAVHDPAACEGEHTWGPWREEVVADCYQEGIFARTCTLCGEVQRVSVPPFHNYDYQVTVVEPTCTENGYILHTCQCGESYALSNGTALGHDLVYHEAQDPTCVDVGWAAYETCNRCDHSTYAEIPASGHRYGYKHTDPTCTEPGYDVYICINCGLRQPLEAEPPLGHDWSEWEVTEDFAQEVIEHRICWRCGEEESRVMAGDYLYGGRCGADLIWTLDPYGTLTITGTGKMDQYYEITPWAPLRELIEKVVVEEGATHITWGAFARCPNLRTATLPDSVVSTQNSLFSYCTGLQQVTLGSGLSEMGPSAFYRCFKLKELQLPDSLTWIGSSAFFNCEALEHLTIPAAVYFIGSHSFVNCTLLKTITFLGDAPDLDEDCFLGQVLTVYYPAGNSTWTEDVRQDYGGTVTWLPICPGEHSFGSWSATMTPTCTLEGREIRVCKFCSISEERILPAQGHNWSQWTASGANQIRSCANCGGKEYIYSSAQMGHNIGDNFYPDGEYIDGMNYLFHRRWATTVKSTLKAENGGYTRVEYTNGVLVIETYDEDLNFLSGRSILMELPIYGGVFLDEDYNFVVSGQNNPDEIDQMEVLRITRYTKDWVKLDHASLYGAYTTEPFSAGTLRFARCADMLHIHTSHQMYTYEDGVRHQSNMSLSVHIPTMEITDCRYMPSYSGTGYVSHSFNQFVLVDGDDYIILDHGDANPRALVMHRSLGAADRLSLPFYKETAQVLAIRTNLGSYNDTGVAVGGVVASSTHYIVAGNSVDHSVFMEQRYGQRNIFITLTPKDDFSTSGTFGYWVTQYAEGDDVELSQPYIVDVGENRFLLIWTENNRLRHCFISGQGELLSEYYENEGALSDCVPFLDGNRVLWYTTGTLGPSNGYLITKKDGLPVFYQIDLDDPGKVTSAKCDHHYESTVTEPTCTESGYTTHTCTLCGRTYTDTPTEPLGHSWEPWQIIVAPTPEHSGEKCRVCSACGLEERVTLPVLEFNYGDVNGDGEVTGKDLILLRQKTAGWDVVTVEACADVNADGLINGKDLILLRQKIAGWDVILGPQ